MSRSILELMVQHLFPQTFGRQADMSFRNAIDRSAMPEVLDAVARKLNLSEEETEELKQSMHSDKYHKVLHFVKDDEGSAKCILIFVANHGDSQYSVAYVTVSHRKRHT